MNKMGALDVWGFSASQADRQTEGGQAGAYQFIN